LNSPWDLALVGRKLYIAMAGPHQIWQLDLEKNEISTFAGSGREARVDGELLKAAFSQPSGITYDGHVLYSADSEANIIRSINPSTAEVDTLVGGDLFDFGDVDGHGDNVRLQHPLGVLAHGKKILIADTYNHRIKELDPSNRTVKTLFGTGKPGQVDGRTPSFYEPGGLSIANKKLYVADTNNHAIRVVNLDTRETSTLRIRELQPPLLTSKNEAPSEEVAPNAEEIKVEPQSLRPGGQGSIVVNLELPNGYHLNPAAPQRYRVSVEQGLQQLTLKPGENAKAENKVVAQSTKGLRLPLRIPVQTLAPGEAEVRVQLTVVYCRDDNTGTCRIKTLLWRAPVAISEGAPVGNELKLQAKIGV
jgi:hypothetical protein